MEHSSDLTVEAMMLDSKASDLDKEERPEVCVTCLCLKLMEIVNGWILLTFNVLDHLFNCFI